jgi:hypothetical protein
LFEDGGPHGGVAGFVVCEGGALEAHDLAEAEGLGGGHLCGLVVLLWRIVGTLVVSSRMSSSIRI